MHRQSIIDASLARQIQFNCVSLTHSLSLSPLTLTTFPSACLNFAYQFKSNFQLGLFWTALGVAIQLEYEVKFVI